MAVSCPRCGNLVEQDFGVATCVHCQAVLFVNMDGYAQITEESANQPALTEEKAPEAYPEPESYSAAGDLNSNGELNSDSDADFTDKPMFGEKPEAEVDQGHPFHIEPAQSKISEFDPDTSETGIFESTEQVLGAISYSIKIENIDTKDVRILVTKALDDVKFQWDSREIMRSVKDGSIELKNLNPVKASVVVQRVRDLPVKISWKQNVYN